MGKVSVIVYLTIGVTLLFYLSRHNNNNNHQQHHNIRRHGHSHRRLKVKSNFTFSEHHHDPIPFDPVVAEIERNREDKEWERMYIEDHHKDIAGIARAAAAADAATRDHAPGHEQQPEWEDFMDAEDYLNDEDKFNVTSRVTLLFPKIDVDPTDGFVSEKELVQWHVRQSNKEVMHRSRREFDVHDKNKDDNRSFGYDLGWWKVEHFNASDIDEDGLLNITEFNDFLHPADANNPKLLQWLCNEEIRERDTDKDGTVSFNEFFHGLFDLVRNYEEEGHNSSHHSDDTDTSAAKELFNQLDKDGDGLLTSLELLPIIDKLHPPERYYAKQQADYILSQADTDKDGRLSLGEMIDNPYVFYSTVFSDDEDDYDYHAELR
ncbi:hypothetical protein KSS87_006402 [Heliosperma pusillum]|nr:hypothetical protein KSS87_006402 [Heliosperma pusillum]